jgi:hypothetical protein
MSVATLMAQETEMITDRPDQTESAYLVPKGWVQGETGFVYEKFSSQVKNYAYNTSLVRYGMLENLELRFGFSYLGSKVKTTEFSDRENGLGPLSFGFKTVIAREDGALPQLAFLSTLTLPNTGSNAFDTDHLGADFRLTMEYSINESMTFGANFGTAWSGMEGEDYETLLYTLVVGMKVSERISGFGELYGFFPGKGSNDHRWDMGLTHKVTENFQLDLSFGIGLNDTAPDHFLSGGFSIRIP